MTRALVTGANGFVGAHLCDHLRASGDDVIATDRFGTTILDITDAQATLAEFESTRPEVVYHLAAFAHVGDSWNATTQVMRINVEGTANVLDAARAARVQRVVVIGSAEEYGLARPEDMPLLEDAPLRPSTPYGASKVAAGYLALQAYLGAGLDTVRVRPFNHTGPGQSITFLVPALARRIVTAERDGADAFSVGSLDPVRDLSDVRDVVRAYRMLAEHGGAGEVYNVCSGVGVTIGEIATRLAALATRPLRPVVDPALVRAIDVPRLVGNPAKLRAATGWKPAHSLDATLQSVLDDARSQGP